MRRNRINLTCAICSEPIEAIPSQIRRGRKYCSHACLSESKRGKPWSCPDMDAFREKQRQRNLGKTIPPETRRKLSEALKGRPNPRMTEYNRSRVGALHPHWKGDVRSEATKIRNSEEMIAWKKEVLKRDGYTCGFCGQSPSGQLAADHIRPFSLYPELRYDVANGQTLCKPCHYFKTRLDHYFYDNFKTRL